jgi:hypothetical protein
MSCTFAASWRSRLHEGEVLLHPGEDEAGVGDGDLGVLRAGGFAGGTVPAAGMVDSIARGRRGCGSGCCSCVRQ